MKLVARFSVPLVALLLSSVASRAAGPASPTVNLQAVESRAAYGEQLEGFNYPWPVERYSFHSQGQALEMAYMDVKPAQPNGRVAVLLHGKNFCAATWQSTITALTQAGYRVIAPDQIGFCKSSKPAQYQFTFQQLASNTHELLASLGVSRATVMGHSTGGMLGVRYALMYPSAVEQLVLVNPIGLEDWKARGVPWQSLDAWYRQALKTTAESVRAYERATYYAGTWEPSYETWVDMLAGMYRGPGREHVAWDSALLSDMIYTQPVIYEFGELRMPVLLMIGDKDTTAIGKDLAPPEVRSTLGNYPVLGKAAAAKIPHAKLVEFPDLGHSPQIQAPERFHKALLEGLQTPAPTTTAETLAPDKVEFEMMTWVEVKQALANGKTTALIYNGGTEQRGPQNVNGGHNLMARETVRAIAIKLGNAITAPVLPFSPNNASKDKPGTIGITPALFAEINQQVAEQLIVSGFKNVVLMGDHGGGQKELQSVAQKLDQKYSSQGIRVIYCDEVYQKAQDDFDKWCADHGYGYGGHAYISDTSETIYLGGDQGWVRNELLPTAVGDPVPTPGQSVVKKIDNGIIGDARQSSAALGKRYFDMKVDYAVRQIRQLLGESAPAGGHS